MVPSPQTLPPPPLFHLVVVVKTEGGKSFRYAFGLHPKTLGGTREEGVT